MTDCTAGFSTPVGRSDSLKVRLPQTMAWPAFAPPLYRTTKSCPALSKSTILLFASSPHWRPTTLVAGIRTFCHWRKTGCKPRMNARGGDGLRQGTQLTCDLREHRP